jgi:hypothetical protein
MNFGTANANWYATRFILALIITDEDINIDNTDLDIVFDRSLCSESDEPGRSHKYRTASVRRGVGGTSGVHIDILGLPLL